ncbi:MAG: VanZ family protein [Nitrospirota bacterium]|nr:MAG: VanZ family protein [Nitrospirota bacterium]
MARERNKSVFFRITLLASMVLIAVIAAADTNMIAPEGHHDKVVHLIAFIYLSFLMDRSFPLTGFNVKKIVSIIIYGVLIEIMQYFISYRHFELLDIAADLAGVLIYGAASLFVVPITKKVQG